MTTISKNRLESRARHILERYQDRQKLHFYTRIDARDSTAYISTFSGVPSRLKYSFREMYFSYPFFDNFFEINRHKAEKILEYMVAHEMGHFEYMCEYGVMSAVRARRFVAEKYSDEVAEQKTGISRDKLMDDLRYMRDKLKKRGNPLADDVNEFIRSGIYESTDKYTTTSIKREERAESKKTQPLFARPRNLGILRTKKRKEELRDLHIRYGKLIDDGTKFEVIISTTKAYRVLDVYYGDIVHVKDSIIRDSYSKPHIRGVPEAGAEHIVTISKPYHISKDHEQIIVS